MRHRGNNTIAVCMAIAIVTIVALATWLAMRIQHPSEKDQAESAAYEFYNALYDRGFGAERLSALGYNTPEWRMQYSMCHETNGETFEEICHLLNNEVSAGINAAGKSGRNSGDFGQPETEQIRASLYLVSYKHEPYREGDPVMVLVMLRFADGKWRAIAVDWPQVGERPKSLAQVDTAGK